MERRLNADSFNLDSLINSMKELRTMQLGDQVRQALEGAKLGLDPAALKDLVHELESDIEEHIGRLEKMSGVMSPEERRQPELMEPTRRQEVAFRSGCDTEEVDSLCEAFSRAREILAGAKGHGGVLDLKLLFSNIPGLSGIELAPGSDGVRKVPAQILEEILGGRFPSGRRKPEREPSLEELFDLEKTAAPRNRLPKDWKP